MLKDNSRSRECEQIVGSGLLPAGQHVFAAGGGWWNRSMRRSVALCGLLFRRTLGKEERRVSQVDSESFQLPARNPGGPSKCVNLLLSDVAPDNLVS
jgi:hypothetical protein